MCMMVTYPGERQSPFVLVCCRTANVLLLQLLSALATYNYLPRWGMQHDTSRPDAWKYWAEY